MPQENKILRTGPRPLWLHLQNALLVAAQQQDNLFFQKYLEGIDRYFHYNKNQALESEYEVYWQKDDVRVLMPLSYAQKTVKNVVLLIPSLINDYRIFDLTKNNSFFRFLQDNDMCPMVIDWGSPYQKGKETLDLYIKDFLEPLLDNLQSKTQDITALGYCMGGLMLLVMDTPERKSIKRIFMATPWDFSKMHQDSKNAAQIIWQMNRFSEGLMPYIPIDMVQSFFAMIDTKNTVQKFVEFCMQEDANKQALFVAVEDWLNHGKPIAYEVFKTCIESWYLNNATMRGEWQYNGVSIDPSMQHSKSNLFVIPQKDKLVSPDSAKALYYKIDNANLIEPETGHVGLMGSINAKSKVWEPVVKWIKSIDN